MLSEEQISAYQKIYRKSFGKDISREDALEQGTKLMTFVEIIYRYSDNTDEQTDGKHNDDI